MMMWVGDLNFRIGATADARLDNGVRRIDKCNLADYPADERSRTIHNACNDGASIYIENRYASGYNSTMRYPKIGICDFTITNSTMHQTHETTKAIKPDVIKKYIKTKSSDRGKVNSDHNPVKLTFNI